MIFLYESYFINSIYLDEENQLKLLIYHVSLEANRMIHILIESNEIVS